MTQSRIFAGNETKSKYTGYSIGGKAVRSVNAAGNFTSCQESRDNSAVSVEYTGMLINRNSAHGIVGSRNSWCEEEREDFSKLRSRFSGKVT